MIKIHHGESKLKRFFKIAFIVILVLIGLNFIISLFSSTTFSGPQAAVIPITGEITTYGSSGLFGGGASAEEIVKQIEAANRASNVKAIILELNTPGGTVVASEEISKAVENSEKPVIAWMREISTSGGYWIAASADEIIASSATITGSIGVTSSYLSYDGLFEEYGIKYERLVSGVYKDTGTPFRNLTGSERLLMQRKINKINDMFISHIAESRDMEVNEVRKLATGEIYLGIEAIGFGLIDTIGGKQEAIAKAEELAGVSPLRFVRYEESVGFFDRLSALTNINIEIKPSQSLAISS